MSPLRVALPRVGAAIAGVALAIVAAAVFPSPLKQAAMVLGLAAAIIAVISAIRALRSARRFERAGATGAAAVIDLLLDADSLIQGAALLVPDVSSLASLPTPHWALLVVSRDGRLEFWGGTPARMITSLPRTEVRFGVGTLEYRGRVRPGIRLERDRDGHTYTGLFPAARTGSGALLPLDAMQVKLIVEQFSGASRQ